MRCAETYTKLILPEIRSGTAPKGAHPVESGLDPDLPTAVRGRTGKKGETPPVPKAPEPHGALRLSPLFLCWRDPIRSPPIGGTPGEKEPESHEEDFTDEPKEKPARHAFHHTW